MRLEGVWLLEIFKESAWGQTHEAFINDLSEIMRSLLMKPPVGIQLGNIVTVQENCSVIKRSWITLGTARDKTEEIEQLREQVHALRGFSWELSPVRLQLPPNPVQVRTHWSFSHCWCEKLLKHHGTPTTSKLMQSYTFSCLSHRHSPPEAQGSWAAPNRHPGAQACFTLNSPVHPVWRQSPSLPGECVSK